MVLADVTGYGIGLFIHVMAVVLAFGPTFAYGIVFSVLPRHPQSAPALFEAIRKVDDYLVNPAMFVVLLAGIYLMADGHWGGGEAFIVVGFVAIVALMGLQHAFFRPQGLKARELAERDLKTGDGFSPEFEAISRRLATVGPLAGLIVAIAIFFMTVKP
jgi:predicted integral membrane protein DUF2269